MRQLGNEQVTILLIRVVESEVKKFELYNWYSFYNELINIECWNSVDCLICRGLPFL